MMSGKIFSNKSEKNAEIEETEETDSNVIYLSESDTQSEPEEDDEDPPSHSGLGDRGLEIVRHGTRAVAAGKDGKEEAKNED